MKRINPWWKRIFGIYWRKTKINKKKSTRSMSLMLFKKLIFFKINLPLKNIYRFMKFVMLSNLPGRMKIFAKHLLIVIISFFKFLTKKKIFLFLTKICVFRRFLFKYLKNFIRKNRKYLRILKRKKFLKVFFCMFVYMLIYKTLLPFKTVFPRILHSVNFKKQRYLFYFFRFNIIKCFKIFYRKFHVLGLKLIIKGKFATLVGGRRKKFVSFFRNSSSTNYGYTVRFTFVNTKTRLGSAKFKFFLVH